jgi:alkanesulfonate monooxygenase SsuD/methylene tetrahydromethanopterin reductase-like flavin-dependent oxidoreductase (luciferase family)
MMPADSDEGLETAARRRVPTGVAYRSVGRARTAFDKYRAFAARHGWTPGPEHCHLLRNVYVAETNQRARAEAEDHLHYMFRKLLSYHRGSMKLLGQSPPPRPAEIRTAEDLPFYEMDFDLLQKEGLSIIGDPEYVTREIRAQMRELGAGVIMGLFQFGSLPHDLARKNITLFGEHVLPALRTASRPLR